MSKKARKDPAYLREQGKREARGVKQRKITFNLSSHISNQGQTIDDWNDSGLLVLLYNRLKFIGQYTTLEVRQKQYIKEYTKVDFPPNSEFKQPTHIIDVTWAVMHVTQNSKEVVVGFIEDDVFYIVFLDKEHKFWPSTLKNT
jgi:hypothetical protein